MNCVLHHIMKRTRNRYHYAIRKCKRASDEILKDKMLSACLAGKDNIFDKIQKMRKVKNALPTTIDGSESPANQFAEVYGRLYNSTNDKDDTEASQLRLSLYHHQSLTSIDGSESPANKFAEVYGKLYNSTNDKDDTENIFREIQSSVDASSLQEVALVTPELIKNVIGEIKSNKNDPVFQFNSNCIKRAPKSFHLHMANIIKLFLIHGHVSETLLIATIVPLLKDKQGDIQSSDNYRSIALSSVVLKIFDWVVLTLFEEQLGLDDLQFSYQKRCSTNMCTWMVVESINHFLRNNSDVYACFMDMKKAFDCVKHSLLFRKLMDRQVSPIFLRLLLYMYANQTAKVKWNGTLSKAFSFLIVRGIQTGIFQFSWSQKCSLWKIKAVTGKSEIYVF